MKKTGIALIRNVEMYNKMLLAYASGEEEFEYDGEYYNRDDIYLDFVKDLKSGYLAVGVEKNH